MNDRDLKRFALNGIVCGLSAEKEKLKRNKDKSRLKQINERIEYLEKEYYNLLNELLNS